MSMNLIEAIDALQEGRIAETHGMIPHKDGTGFYNVSIRFYPAPAGSKEEDIFEVVIDGQPQTMTEGQLLEWIQRA